MLQHVFLSLWYPENSVAHFSKDRGFEAIHELKVFPSIVRLKKKAKFKMQSNIGEWYPNSSKKKV